jgi:SAM-dependent methyltransferase
VNGLAMTKLNDHGSTLWARFLSDSTLFDSAIRLEPLIRLVNQYASPPGRLLETGFGSGHVAVFLAEMGYRMVAIDIDDELVGRAVERYSYWLDNYSLTFERGDLFKLPWPEKAFDLVYHQGVLEHFSDEEIVAALREQGRVASWIIFDVPNSRYGHHPFGNERLLPLTHWRRLIEAAGLRIKEIRGRMFPLWTRLLPACFLSRRRIGPPDFFSRQLARVFIFVCFPAQASRGDL